MMKRLAVGAAVAILAANAGVDVFACGDKFLVGGRGTRFQRPKNARAASVLIYAQPSSEAAATLKKSKVESLLKLEGHKATSVQSLNELSTIVSTGRYDVILTGSNSSADVQKLLGVSPDAAVVLAIDELVKNKNVLQAIDKAVALRDSSLKRTTARSS